MSGWWGTARHINYLGDWLMSWAYCLPTLAAGYKITPSLLYPGTRVISQGEAKGCVHTCPHGIDGFVTAY